MDKGSDLNSEIETFKTRINSLEKDLNEKECEIDELIDTVESLEETIMKLESIIPKEDGNNNLKNKDIINSKFAMELEEKDKIIRNLKDRMGFLRKEKSQFQQELQKIKIDASNSSVIRTESLRSKPPLEILVKELQDRVNKNKSIITQLKRESIDVSEFDNELKKKEEALERKMAYSLQAQVDDQINTIQLKNKELELLKQEREQMRTNFEVLQIQNKMKDQKIEDLNNLLKRKGSKKRE